ncbi:MAG: hypothetical protein ACTS1X_00880 [Parasphingopyxis sp.]|uniref:hypothetical protein n=1 Tax=Parasphingopyxis sp. TaxID=1920299 RepID=UPI003FA18EDB
MMTALFASGHAADIVLAVLAAEAVWLTARGNSISTVLATLLPAALLVLGLRGALTGAPWPWIALPVAAALPAHLWDLARRGMLARRERR